MIGRPVAVRMIGVALHLGGPAFVGLHEQGHRPRAGGHGRGKMHWHAVHIILPGHLFAAKGNDVFLRPATAHAQHTGTGQSGGGAHEL